MSHAFREATDSLQRDKDHNVAACTRFVAEKTERVSDYLRSCDSDRFRGDVEQSARRRPELFFGGMFVVGLAFSRILKARPAHPSHDEPLSGAKAAAGFGEQFAKHDWSAT